MWAQRLIGPALILAALLVGCIGQQFDERNPFLTAAEAYGTSVYDEQGPGTGAAAEVEFRQTMNVTLANNNPDAELDVAFAAWVEVSSIRSAEQQDALLSDGYVQLTREVRIGAAFTLPPGTFVYNGPGTAGATVLRLARASADDGETAAATTEVFTLITPDVIFVFEEPPVSCESKAFVFTDNGFPLDTEYTPGGRGHVFEGATGEGDAKTLAQVDVYECEPLRPGLFFKSGGGRREDNEFFEGMNVQFDFNPTPDAGGNFAIVTISSPSSGTGEDEGP